MFKYIKWELQNFFKRNWGIGIFIGVIFLLSLLVFNIEAGEDIVALVTVPFYFTLTYLTISMFIQGTKVIIGTYKNKTFLLESMIAYSPAKLLLAKYLIAIILNIFFGILLLIGLAIAFSAVDLNIFVLLKEFFQVFTMGELIQLIIGAIVSAVSLSSLIVMVYIITKCINPNKKGTTVIGIIIWWVILYIQGNIIYPALGLNQLEYNSASFYFIILINLIMIVIYYFVSVKLIKDKLEIYS